MEFFKPLVEVAGKFETLTIKIAPVGDKLTVLVLPGVNNKELTEKLIPVTMTGTAQELDDEFLVHIKQAISAVAGVTTNLEQFEKKLEEAGKELEEEAKDSKPAKSNKKHKPAAKKPAPKKKVLEPVIEAGEEKEEEDETEKQEELFA